MTNTADPHLKSRLELAGIVDDIALWADRFTPGPHGAHAHPGELPYLAMHYEFLGKRPGLACWIPHIYAFNFSAMASTGPVSIVIGGQRYAVPRIVRGLTESPFLGRPMRCCRLQPFSEPELDPATAIFNPVALAADGEG